MNIVINKYDSFMTTAEIYLKSLNSTRNWPTRNWPARNWPASWSTI